LTYPKACRGGARGKSDHLLDVLVLARAGGLLADPACAAVIAPSAGALGNTDVLVFVTDGLVAVDGDEVAAQVMLPAEGAATRPMGAGVGLEPVRVVGLQVRLEVVGTSECCGGEVSEMR
jgi:hypothetical protein